MRRALAAAALVLAAALAAGAQSRQMSVAELEPIFQEASAEAGVDVRLLRVVAWIESNYRPGAVSYKNGKPCAYGLMQLVPATAARFGVSEVFDPRQNVRGGARYLRYLLDLFGGDVNLAMAGYNAGEGNVLKYGRRVPPFSETRGYVARGTALLARTVGPAFYRPAAVNQQPPAAPNTAKAAPPPPSVTTSFVRRAAPQAEASTRPVVKAADGAVSFVRRPPPSRP